MITPTYSTTRYLWPSSGEMRICCLSALCDPGRMHPTPWSQPIRSWHPVKDLQAEDPEWTWGSKPQGETHHVELSPDDSPFSQSGRELLHQGELARNHSFMLPAKNQMRVTLFQADWHCFTWWGSDSPTHKDENEAGWAWGQELCAGLYHIQVSGRRERIRQHSPQMGSVPAIEWACSPASISPVWISPGGSITEPGWLQWFSKMEAKYAAF